MIEPVVQDTLDESVHSLRGSLIDLIVSAGGNPSKPQEVSRRFGIDKSLCWKVSRVVNATEPSAALTYMPGDAAIEIFLSAFAKAGAALERLGKVRHAVQSLHATVETHFGDRPTLKIILDSMPNKGEDRLVQSRKLAFRGNSGIWGVQAQVRVNTIILAPNAEEPECVDSALLGGWVDFRRLRTDSEWTLFNRRTFRNGKSIATKSIPFDPTESASGPMLMREYCTPSLPPITILEEDGVTSYQLGPSTIGNPGTFSCFFGSVDRNLGSRFSQSADESADFHAIISAPVEVLLFDLFVHHSLSFAMTPQFKVYGTPTADPRQRKERDVLPIRPVLHEMGSRPPVVATPLVSQYSQLINSAFDRAGWNLEDFVGLRYILDYPPFRSTVGVTIPLDKRS